MIDNRTTDGKIQQQYIEAQFTQSAREAASTGQTGAPKRTKRKTDWFGLIAVGVIILIAAAVVLLLR